jgi:hypothetical protein
VFHLAGVHPGPDLQAKVEKLQEQLAARWLFAASFSEVTAAGIMPGGGAGPRC